MVNPCCKYELSYLENAAILAAWVSGKNMKFSLPDGFVYKSFSAPFAWADIPKFVVLTGENGAGKTQLLEMIFQATEPMHGAGVLSEDTVSRQTSAFFNRSFFFDTPSRPVTQFEVQSMTEVIAGSIKNRGPINTPAYTQYVHHTFAKKVADPSTLSVQEIAEKLPFNFGFPQQADPIVFFDNIIQAVGQMCMRFALKEASAAHRALVDGRTTSLLEIREEIGHRPPWEEINEIFALAKFQYRLQAPSSPHETSYFLRLQSTPTGALIDLNHLSRGEQSILGLAFLFYTLRKDGIKLRLLLLDEPDAHLHSSLIRVFLNLIESVIVAEFDCRVIMTTHRLETIVQAQENDLYLLKKLPHIVAKTTARAATSALTSALILAQRSSLSVLVEDEDDERFYKAVFDAFVRLDAWKSEHRIEFKSVAKTVVGKEDGGGASVVKSKIASIQKIVDTFDSLTPYRFLFGLIDRDRDNQKSAGVEVLCRYSMENYLFEPLVVFCQLLAFDDAPQVKGLRPLGSGDYSKVRELPVSEKQAISDWVIEEIEKQWAAGPIAQIEKLTANELEKVEVAYVDGSPEPFKLTIPKWLIDRRGHDLQKVFDTVFNGRMNAGALRKVFSYLRVIPMDLLTIFESFVERGDMA
jgi:ABC-type multidrug transport system ATPase subunit